LEQFECGLVALYINKFKGRFNNDLIHSKP
jgi:hypothetical protein